MGLFSKIFGKPSDEDLFVMCREAAQQPLFSLITKINERIDDPSTAIENWVTTFAEQKPLTIKDVEALEEPERKVLAAFFIATDPARKGRTFDSGYIAENVLHAWKAIMTDD